jgi:sugar lactone lactonase YvrE
MRRTILLLAAMLALGVSGALAQAVFPQKIDLPNGFAPEGIEVGKGNTVYVGSVGTGAVWAGDLRTGSGDILIPGAANVRAATGIEYDRGRLWVAGARFGNVRVYDAETGDLLREYQLATGTAPTFINDLVVTKDAVWLTDSMRPVLYKVALSGNGEPGDATTIQLTGSGDYQHVAGFNLNGIVATPDGKTLIAVQSGAKKLYTIDAETGATKLIDLGGYDLANGDGLLLQGRTLYVVQNQLDKVAVFQLSPDLTKATFVQTLTTSDPTLLSVPTTIDRKGSKLYVVNARFGRTSATDQRYWITRLR